MADVPNLDPSLLTQHADGLRQLVRRLVLDDHRVDDVLQETWLRAIQTPPRNPRAWGSWLRTVATRLAIRSRHGETDRARHETTAHRDRDGGTPDDSAPSAADIVEREMARRKVVDAVMGLKQPYRDAILLRFFENLSAQDIAQRLDLPLETVRTRVKRGLAKLRERLDHSHDGDHAAWHASLLPLFTLPIAPVAAAATTTTAVGIAWKLWALRTVAALFVLLGGLTAYVAFTSPDPEDGPAPVVSFTIAELEPTDEWDSPTEASASLATTPAPTRTALLDAKDEVRPTLIVEGRVVDAAARPVPQAEVTLSLRPRWQALRRGDWDRSAAVAASRVRRSVHTGPDGRFRFEGPAHEETTLLLAARHPDLAPATLVEAWHAEEGPLQLADLVMPDPHALRGRITTADGIAVEGARIALHPEHTQHPAHRATARLLGSVQTDSSGAFDIRGVPPGDYVLSISGAGQLPLTRPVQLPAGVARTDLGSIALPAIEVLRGEVRDEFGQPVADAHIEGWPGVRRGQSRGRRRVEGADARTDAQGRFSLPTAPGQSLMLRVVHPSLATTEHGPITAATWAAITLRSRATLEGTAADARTGKPVEDAVVEVRSASRSRAFGPRPSDRVTSADDGRFTVAGLQPDRRHTLRVSARGYVSQTLPLATINANEPVLVWLEPALAITGVVRDAATGAPIVNALIEIGTEPGAAGRFTPTDRQRTDATGRFVSASLPAGPCTVRVSTIDHAPQVLSTILAANATELDVRLGTGASVLGRVTDHQRSQRRLVVFQHDSGIRRSTPVDPITGAYAIDRLTAGTHTVHVENLHEPMQRRARSAGRQLTVPATGSLRFDLAAIDPGLATLRGRIVTVPAGAVLAATLRPFDSTTGTPQAPFARIDRDGSFELRRVQPSRYRLVIFDRRPGNPVTVHEEVVELTPGAVVERSIALPDTLSTRPRK